MVFTINGEETYELGHRMGMSHCSDPVQIDVGGNYVFKLGSGCAIVLEAQQGPRAPASVGGKPLPLDTTGSSVPGSWAPTPVETCSTILWRRLVPG